MKNENEKSSILIIDDEPLVRNLIYEILQDNYACEKADSAEEALKILNRKTFNLVLTDINLGGMTGIDMIPHVLTSAPDTVIMMISGERTIESAIQAMRVGAFDYIAKPLDLDHIELAVKRALEHHFLLVAKRLHETQLEELVKQRTEELIYLSYHDALTDLPNSILFEDRLSQAVNQANRNKHGLAMMYLAIDRFNQIYDILGHKIGYELLKEVADRLKKSIREDFTIARFEGNEFALLIPQIKGSEDVIESANSIYEAMSHSFLIEGKEIFISFSTGISIFPDDAVDEQRLLKNARIALARSKEKGGNNYQFYISGMNEKALKRLSLENSLRKALEREEFQVFYQPKLNIFDNEVIGMEALVRWQHPEMGLISPGDFIPLAEETGLIIPLGEWILRTSCLQVKKWQEKKLKTGVLSVNISARQFQQKDLIEVISHIIKGTGLKSGCLELELTETYLMSNPEASVSSLNALKELGVKLSIDDFGTGYSSLSYLKRFPIDILKIDRSFVKDLTSNSEDVELVTAITTLAHNLNLKVVAEGVETEEQLNFLKTIKCDEWQGYHCSKPVDPETFERMFLKNSGHIEASDGEKLNAEISKESKKNSYYQDFI